MHVARANKQVVLMIAEDLPELLLTEQTIHRVTAARLHDAQIVMDALGQKLDELNVRLFLTRSCLICIRV